MPPVLRSNPLYTEEEEQEVVIVVDEETPDDATDADATDAPDAPRVPRRAPSTSSGYGSAGGSHGRVSPNLPKSEQYEPEPRRLSSEKTDGSLRSTSDSDASPSCTLSRSLKEDIRACLGCRDYPVKQADFTQGMPIRWERDIGEVVEAAVRGAGGISAARARLHAALLALHDPPHRGPSLPYCGPGVRPGDVTMMPKTEMSLLAASALFTLDGSRGEELTRRLARGEKRRRRCRAVLALIALLLLIAAICAVELLMSRGQRVFGAVLR
ncbi:uncharacterized protein LOC112042938 [Bicyclus anynana]|uniref:Uncharacterized protein LOC112042938 n=1 Tax=Bicyclus anynana TaxID=110368 RepID=A0A6J1MMC0_BICAN|nr:uncharacterized protein LOC112042938 [Bicyclus anynana]